MEFSARKLLGSARAFTRRLLPLCPPAVTPVLCLTGLVVMGQPVAGSDDEDEGDSSSDSEEEEADGDTSPGGGGKEGGRDKEVGVVEEDSASLMHPVTKVSFALMQKLRDLPIAGGAFRSWPSSLCFNASYYLISGLAL